MGVILEYHFKTYYGPNNNFYRCYLLPLKKVNAISFNHHRTPLRHHDLTSCVACQRFHSRPLIALEKSSKNVGKHMLGLTTDTFAKNTWNFSPVKLSIRYQKRCALEHVTPFKHGNLLVSMLNLREGTGTKTRASRSGFFTVHDPTDWKKGDTNQLNKTQTLNVWSVDWVVYFNLFYLHLGSLSTITPLNYPDLPSLEGKVDPFRQKSLDIMT